MIDPFTVYYSLREIAGRTSFSPSAVRTWYLSGRLDSPLPVVQIGADIRIPEANIVAFLLLHNVTMVPRTTATRRLFAAKIHRKGIAARNTGELRRKVAAEAAAAAAADKLDDGTNV